VPEQSAAVAHPAWHEPVVAFPEMLHVGLRERFVRVSLGHPPTVVELVVHGAVYEQVLLLHAQVFGAHLQ
jgi:hypothetical protein